MSVAHLWSVADVRGSDLHDADALLRRAQTRAALTIVDVRAVRTIGLRA